MSTDLALNFQQQPLAQSRVAAWLNPNRKSFITASCWILLLVWFVWWGASFRSHCLQGNGHLWFQPPQFGGDFYYFIDRGSRVWWHGGDVYAGKTYVEKYFYPPPVLQLFAWVNCCSPRTALMMWLPVLTAIFVAAAWMASRIRDRLGLSELSPLAAVVMILFSTPVIFALERGQCDPLSLVVILAAMPLLKRESKWAQFAAGGILCLAPWIKVYPGLLAVGLIGLRRWRALAGFIVIGALIGLIELNSVKGFLACNAFHVNYAEKLARLSLRPRPWNHPLALSFSGLMFRTRLDSMAIPLGRLAAATVLLPMLTWVTYHVWRCPKRDVLTYPLLLWVIALATFVPPISNDYNLFFLPLAAITLWDRRDPLLVHIALAILLLWWQPIGMSIDGLPMLFVKLLGLGAVAVSLVNRACEQSSAAPSVAVAGT